MLFELTTLQNTSTQALCVLLNENWFTAAKESIFSHPYKPSCFLLNQLFASGSLHILHGTCTESTFKFTWLTSRSHIQIQSSTLTLASHNFQACDRLLSWSLKVPCGAFDH